MNRPTAARVKVAGATDLSGTLDATAWPADESASVRVRLDDGRQILVPRNMLVRQSDGSYELALGHTNIEQLTAALGPDAREVAVVPVVAETLEVGKRAVETGRVRVTKVVREEQQVVDQPLLREEVTVERVPVERFVESAPAARQEGDTLVIPLVEEVLVVEKRLLLREEVRVTRRRTEYSDPQTVTVRREEAKVERIPANQAGVDGTNVA